MTTQPTQNLVRRSQLAKEFGIGNDKTVQEILEKAKIKPVVFVPGKGGMILYDGDMARVKIRQHLDIKERKAREAERAKKAAVPAPAPAVIQQPVIDKRIDILMKQANDQHALLETLAAQVNRITEALPILLKTIERVGNAGQERDSTLSLQLQSIMSSQEALRVAVESWEPEPAMDAPVPPPAAERLAEAQVAAGIKIEPTTIKFRPVKEPEPVAAPKRRVLVVGIWDRSKEELRREFKDAFDLTLLNADEASGVGFANKMKNADHVIFVTKFINHSMENVAKTNGIKPIRVPGGVSQVRDKLTDIFCNEPSTVTA